MKIKSIKPKKLSGLEIVVDEDGFTVWITEERDDGIKVRHWLIDGSAIKKNGKVLISGVKPEYKYHAVIKFSDDDNSIKLVNIKPKEQIKI